MESKTLVQKVYVFLDRVAEPNCVFGSKMVPQTDKIQQINDGGNHRDKDPPQSLDMQETL